MGRDSFVIVHGNDELTNRINQKAQELWDLFEAIKDTTGTVTTAKTNLETAVTGVKSILPKPKK